MEYVQGMIGMRSCQVKMEIVKHLMGTKQKVSIPIREHVLKMMSYINDAKVRTCLVYAEFLAELV